MPKEHDPELIRQKIEAGLTLEQAIEVLDRQAGKDAGVPVKEKKLNKQTPGTAGSGK